MKPATIIGILLILLGIIGFAVGGISFTHEKKDVDIGPVQICHNRPAPSLSPRSSAPLRSSVASDWSSWAQSPARSRARSLQIARTRSISSSPSSASAEHAHPPADAAVYGPPAPQPSARLSHLALLPAASAPLRICGPPRGSERSTLPSARVFASTLFTAYLFPLRMWTLFSYSIYPIGGILYMYSPAAAARTQKSSGVSLPDLENPPECQSVSMTSASIHDARTRR